MQNETKDILQMNLFKIVTEKCFVVAISQKN